MQICYVDESGDEQPLRSRLDPPVLVIAGLVVDSQQLKPLIWDFLQLKKRFFAKALGSDAMLSEVIRYEVKGSDLRSSFRDEDGRGRRVTVGLLDQVLRLLEQRNVSLIGEVHVKRDEKPLGRWVYANSIADIAGQFEILLGALNSDGLMILDARTKHKNVPSVHTITTRKFKTGGDGLKHLLESPVFGHSDAHVVLQLSDIVASAFLFPMACATYCSDVGDNVHLHDRYAELRDRYGKRLQHLEHRYTDSDGKTRGGVRVRDSRKRSGDA